MGSCKVCLSRGVTEEHGILLFALRVCLGRGVMV